MSAYETLLQRNSEFADNFAYAELAPLPKLQTFIVACADSRVDPAYVLGLKLGEAVTIRNAGARVTQDVINEIGALCVLAQRANPDVVGKMSVVLLQHTNCGATMFANPDLQQAIKEKTGIDVSETVIIDHDESIKADIEKLRNAREVPGHLIISGAVYDVKTGLVRTVVEPAVLRA